MIMLLFQTYFIIAGFALLPRTDTLPIRRLSRFGVLPLSPQIGESLANTEFPLLAENNTKANGVLSCRQVSAPTYRIAQFARYMPTIGRRTLADGPQSIHSLRIETHSIDQPEVPDHKAGENISSTSIKKEKIVSDPDDTLDSNSIQVETKQALEITSNTSLNSKSTKSSNTHPTGSISTQTTPPNSSNITAHEQPPLTAQGSPLESTEEPTEIYLDDNEHGNATDTALPYTPGWCGLHVRQVYSYTCMRFNLKGCVSVISAITLFDAAQKLIGSANVTLTYDTTNTYSLESVLPHPVVFTQLGVLEGVAFTRKTKPWETNMWPVKMSYGGREWRNDDVGACRSGAWEHLNENRDFDCGFAC